jgi:hypothetical protein
MTRGSWCTVLCCLTHRREGFVRIDVQPPVFVHTAGMTDCGEVPPFDLDELLVPEGETGPGWVLPNAWEVRLAPRIASAPPGVSCPAGLRLERGTDDHLRVEHRYRDHQHMRT